MILQFGLLTNGKDESLLGDTTNLVYHESVTQPERNRNVHFRNH